MNDYLGLHETMNKEKFKEFLENKVKPAVQRLRIGQSVLLLDNATCHNND